MTKSMDSVTDTNTAPRSMLWPLLGATLLGCTLLLYATGAALLELSPGWPGWALACVGLTVLVLLAAWPRSRVVPRWLFYLLSPLLFS